MNEKVVNVIKGVIAMAVGILIAIFGGQSVMNIYIGVAAVIAGALMLALEAYAVYKKQAPSLITMCGAGALIAIAIALFVGQADVAGAFVSVLVAAVLGFGVALVIYGIYPIAHKQVPFGIGVMVIGAVMATFGILWYVLGADFHRVFWIVVGSLIAASGLLFTVLALTDGKKISRKK